MITGIPLNVIAGPLGVGKTTALNWLASQRPATERWAVLINEYGLVGLDAALLATEQSASELAIKEVAGGCICCSAGPVFEVSLIQLLRRRPDRVLIEPTGLATLSGILDTLGREGIREAVDVRSTICMLNPATLSRDLERDDVRDQVEAADVVLANRSDQATPEQLHAFSDWAASLFPRRAHVGQIEQGRIPMALLDLVGHRGEAAAGAAAHRYHDHHHGRHHHDVDDGVSRVAQLPAPQATRAKPIVRQIHQSPTTTTLGWLCWKGLIFDARQTAQWIDSLLSLPGVRRIKAVLRTSEGWRAFNLVDGDSHEVRPSSYRRDSRIELIIESETPPDPLSLEQVLRACLRAE